MAGVGIHYMVLAFVIAGVLISGDLARAEEAGQTDLQELIGKCKECVQVPGTNVPPSSECCAVIKKVDIPCICKFVTPEVEKIISMLKLVYACEQCHKPFAHGSKCGSYTVPMA